jgi:hypothetical protein
MKDSQALQIAISSITGVLIPNNQAQKIIDAYRVIKASPDSTTIKELKELNNETDAREKTLGGTI